MNDKIPRLHKLDKENHLSLKYVHLEGLILLIEHLREIEAAQNSDDVWRLAVSALDTVGVRFVTYLTVATGYLSPVLYTTLPELYENYDPGQDPFLHHCCASYDITATGAAFLDDYPYLPTAARNFIKGASRLGFQSGFGIPVRLIESSRFGGLNIGTYMDRSEFELKLLPQAEHFRLFALILHRRLEELDRPKQGQTSVIDVPHTSALDALSPREREIIWLIARGLSRKEIARHCKLSPNTIAEYTRNIYRKLNVRNRVEATRITFGSEATTNT